MANSNNTVEQGVNILGAYWDRSAEIRVQHPQPGAERRAAFVAARVEVVNALAAVGLPMLVNLPGGKSAAMDEARSLYTAYLKPAAAKRTRKGGDTATDAAAA